MDGEDIYANIRELLGHFIGQRVLEITQHDREEWQETGKSYVMLMFENGDYLKFPTGDEPFSYSVDRKEPDASDPPHKEE